jgi:uncharacterized protein YndB with AHSA1/START domain
MSASITLARDFAAAPARVFAAWTNPEAILKWWGMPGFTNLEAAFEAKAGGRWSVTSRHPDGGVVTAYGTVIEVIDGERLVYDWRFDNQPAEAPSSLVTVRFSPSQTGTRVVVEHSGLMDPAMAPTFEIGWTYTLDNFAANVLDKNAA